MLYKIKKNRHYSQWTMPQLHLHASGFKIIVKFSENCIYNKSELGYDWADINKLYGLGFGLNHHNNSFRIGWRAEGKKIHLFSYWYDNHKLNYDSIGIINVNEEYAITVNFGTKKTNVTVFNKNSITYMYNTIIFNRYNKCFFGFVLNPYFGGNKTAPHDMEINILKSNILN